MAHNRSKIWKHKSASLKSLYGLDDDDHTPLSYRQYLIKMLNRSTWGEDVVLHALSCLFRMKITVVNANRLDEARYPAYPPSGGLRHGVNLQQPQPLHIRRLVDICTVSDKTLMLGVSTRPDIYTLLPYGKLRSKVQGDVGTTEG